jgi:hypothetical protein
MTSPYTVMIPQPTRDEYVEYIRVHGNPASTPAEAAANYDECVAGGNRLARYFGPHLELVGDGYRWSEPSEHWAWRAPWALTPYERAHAHAEP